jgi:ssRNA-specific RNase YbeY (16S rRNA maturation enzyme)
VHQTRDEDYGAAEQELVAQECEQRKAKEKKKPNLVPHGALHLIGPDGRNE